MGESPLGCFQPRARLAFATGGPAEVTSIPRTIPCHAGSQLPSPYIPAGRRSCLPILAARLSLVLLAPSSVGSCLVKLV